MSIQLSVIIPVYNSQSTIVKLIQSCTEELLSEFPQLEFVLVNDGSKDRSHDAILELLDSDIGCTITYMNLSRNFGEHNAVMCGLKHCSGDNAVIIDDDFQNPPGEIAKLVARLEDGYDVIYSYYEKKKHSAFRNLGSKFNDKVASLILNKPGGLYLSSFKALNRFTIDAICDYDGPYPYIDGLILRSTRLIDTQLCEHDARTEGESNYTLKKLVSLWLNMFTSFSILPLRLASYAGLAMSVIGFALALFFIISWSLGGILTEGVPKGWASLIVSITIFSGIQLLVLGMAGEYIGRIFLTQNKQPQFMVRSKHIHSPGITDNEI
jgi:undecaprenyl-phosphate 4-deoxy-4-formamido-L-arabinose transferase